MGWVSFRSFGTGQGGYLFLMVGFWRAVSFLVVVVEEEREKGGGNWFSYRVLLAVPGFFWLEATWATEEVRSVDVNWLFFR